MNLIEIAKSLQENERFTSGHRLCPGCGESINIKLVLSAIKEPVVVINTTSCLEVATTIYPYTAWKTPWIHNAFENSSATASGVIEAYRAILKKAGCSPNHISPAERSSNPAINRKVVVFPQPEGPRKEKHSPALILRLTLFTAVTAPKVLVTNVLLTSLRITWSILFSPPFARDQPERHFSHNDN